ncbi:hypothetical protein AKJ40_03130, partial [candidate division MSBL1 archaeon SCGC-AAA259M10]
LTRDGQEHPRGHEFKDWLEIELISFKVLKKSRAKPPPQWEASNTTKSSKSKPNRSRTNDPQRPLNPSAITKNHKKGKLPSRQQGNSACVGT